MNNEARVQEVKQELRDLFFKSISEEDEEKRAELYYQSLVLELHLEELTRKN
jgi:hypothetical protein